MRFSFDKERMDIVFDPDETAFEVAATLLAVCAYPETAKLNHNGPAMRFWEALLVCNAEVSHLRHPIQGLPERRPGMRSRVAHLEKGLERLEMLMELSSAIAISWADNGSFGLRPTRDFRRMKLSLKFDPDGRLVRGPKPPPKSLAETIKFFRPIIGRGRDEFGTSELDSTKTLRKRYVGPMFRVWHVLSSIRSELVGLGKAQHAKTGRKRPWAEILLEADPTWVLRVIERSRQIAPHKAAWARQHGVRSASMDNMIHFHLPRHLQILPPAAP